MRVFTAQLSLFPLQVSQWQNLPLKYAFSSSFGQFNFSHSKVFAAPGDYCQ
jgi:hypothetical protein